MRRIMYFLHAIGMLFLLASCINDDLKECPVYTVKVYVKDKNYSNIDNIPQLEKKNENTPFGGFIGTVYYQLRNLKTGDVVMESSDNDLSKDDQFYTITFNNISGGDYELTVWGNLPSETSTGILHSNGNELTDMYVATKKLSVNTTSLSDELMMERAKGDLVLICSNFPTDINRVEQKISSLYDTVDPHFAYMGSATILKATPMKSIIETKLAPSVNGNSKLNIHFTSDIVTGTSKDLLVSEIPVNISRNQVTLIQVDYNKVTGTLDIWTYVNGEWTMIHHLDILNIEL